MSTKMKKMTKEQEEFVGILLNTGNNTFVESYLRNGGFVVEETTTNTTTPTPTRQRKSGPNSSAALYSQKRINETREMLGSVAEPAYKTTKPIEKIYPLFGKDYNSSFEKSVNREALRELVNGGGIYYKKSRGTKVWYVCLEESTYNFNQQTQSV